MIHCLILSPVNFSDDLVSSVMKRGTNGWVAAVVETKTCPFLFSNEHLHAWLLSLLLIFPSASLTRRCCVLYSVSRRQAGRQPGSLRASRKLQQWGSGPDGAAGWLRQKSCQAKKERPLPVQDWGKKMLFCRCLKACLRRQSGPSRAYRCPEAQTTLLRMFSLVKKVNWDAEG